MKRMLFACLLCLSSISASALELQGVKLDEQVQVADQKLVLNGAGVRSIFFIKMYVAGLYLSGKQTSAAAVMADAATKRIALNVVVDDADTEHFLNGFRKGIAKNHGEKEMAELQARLDAFIHLFDNVKEVKKGDVIAFDWMPGNGTRVTFNGTELGKVAGEDFYRALLSIWIGEKPVSSDMKKGLLGG
jgi:hypothetical protein